MGTIPRFNSPGQFDHFCKLVLRNEAINHLQELKHRRDNETVFSALPQAEMDKLCTTDRYSSDSYVFSSYGCDLPIENELVAKALHKGKELPPLSVIHAARAGDAEAMDCILRYYEGYINKLCTREIP